MLQLPGFLGSEFFTQNYSPAEKTFLRHFLTQHKDIHRKFDEYVAMPAHKRLAAAERDLETVTRASWDNIQVPGERQSVAGHVRGMLKWADQLSFGADMDIRRMIELHDICEAIVGDIPNHEVDSVGKISRKDKEMIERLAARLMFECPDFAADKQLYDEYELRQSLSAKRAKAIDILELVDSCLSIESDKMTVYPERFSEFWRTSIKRMEDAFGGSVPHEIQLHMNRLVNGRDTLHNVYL